VLKRGFVFRNQPRWNSNGWLNHRGNGVKPPPASSRDGTYGGKFTFISIRFHRLQ
ncbi:hypothetical protein LINGRAHAP2_LOCUS20239, partial [Linum grandiflorum]